jgi:hypothetical protein
MSGGLRISALLRPGLRLTGEASNKAAALDEGHRHDGVARAAFIPGGHRPRGAGRSQCAACTGGWHTLRGDSDAVGRRCRDPTGGCRLVRCPAGASSTGSGPWWHAVGGAASAVYVLAAILVAPRLGAVVAIGVLIAGQTFASLLLDGFGMLGVPHRGFPTAALVGAGLTRAGVMALVRDRPARSRRCAQSRGCWHWHCRRRVTPLSGSGKRAVSRRSWCAFRGRLRQLCGRNGGDAACAADPPHGAERAIAPL